MKWFFLILFLPTLARGQTTQPATFGIILPPGVAPCVLHVNGLKFPLATGTPLTARYDWDFGDPAGKFNTLTGFTAAHLFNLPGNYSVSLTVTDETGLKKTVAIPIVISPDHRHTVFVSADGSDRSTGLSPGASLKTLAAAFKLAPAGTTIRLKAGDTFFVTSVLKLQKSDFVLTRFGDGSDPVICLQRSEDNKDHGFISIDKGINGALFDRLIFDTPYAAPEGGEAPKVGIDAIIVRGRNITVRDCTFLNVDTAINGNGNPVGLLVQGCRAPLKTGLRAYLVWGQGSDLVYLGNSAANSTREHIVRLSEVDRALIEFNDFTNLDLRPGDKYDTSKGTIEMHRGSYAYIAHNKVADGTIRVGPLGLHEDPSTATDWAVIESNELTDTYIVAYSGSHHIMIRNNIIHRNEGQAIVITAADKDGRTNGDIHLLNNTAINSSKNGMFLKVWGHVDGIVMKNNLYVAPNLEPGKNGNAAVNTAENDLSSFTEIGHNIWPTFSSAKKTGVFSIGGKDQSAAEWAANPVVKEDRTIDIEMTPAGTPAPSATAELAGRGEPCKSVVLDHDDKRRPADHPTIGAVELPGNK